MGGVSATCPARVKISPLYLWEDPSPCALSSVNTALYFWTEFWNKNIHLSYFRPSFSSIPHNAQLSFCLINGQGAVRVEQKLRRKVGLELLSFGPVDPPGEGSSVEQQRPEWGVWNGSAEGPRFGCCVSHGGIEVTSFAYCVALPSFSRSYTAWAGTCTLQVHGTWCIHSRKEEKRMIIRTRKSLRSGNALYVYVHTYWM